MATHAYYLQPSIVRIPVLVDLVREGKIKVPYFQRRFVWRDEQRTDLCDSIFKGIPIGSFMVWRTDDDTFRCRTKVGPILVNGAAANHERKPEYLLDGHQRLTTLVSALSPRAEKVFSNDEDPKDWNIIFHLEEEAFEIEAQITIGKAGLDPIYLPLHVLLEPSALFEHQRKIATHYATEDARAESLIRKSESVATLFKDTSVPVIPLAVKGLDQATISFQRTNSQGTPMSEVHMVNALTWSTDFDLIQLLEEGRAKLPPVGWRNIQDKVQLQLIKVLAGLSPLKGKVATTAAKLKAKPALIDEAQTAITCAVEFLRKRCQIYGPMTLPYVHQMVLLAAASAAQTRAGSSLEDLSDETLKAVRQWFWITTYTEFFGGINSSKYSAGECWLEDILAGKKRPKRPRQIERTIGPTLRFDYRAARSRAVIWTLAYSHPDRASRRDAFELLARDGNAALMPLCTARQDGITSKLASSPGNRFLVDPNEQSAWRKKLRDPSTLTDADCSRHLINKMAREHLENSDWGSFLRLRNQEIWSRETKRLQRFEIAYDESFSWESS
ncbi:MAG: DUF262 domain-containing protein [Deltaproteobacteria bacterium]|nr:DUF262 domain-containing protein [Deltaproteobacteria bacterium]